MRFVIITAFTLIGFLLQPSKEVFGQSEDSLARAGCPHQIAPYARVGYGSRYIVYYVGGGSGAKISKGVNRNCNEGTFGVDYMPIVPGFHQAVALRWWHGQRHQGGTGQYEPNSTVPAFPNAPSRLARMRFSFD